MTKLKKPARDEIKSKSKFVSSQKRKAKKNKIKAVRKKVMFKLPERETPSPMAIQGAYQTAKRKKQIFKKKANATVKNLIGSDEVGSGAVSIELIQPHNTVLIDSQQKWYELDILEDEVVAETNDHLCILAERYAEMILLQEKENYIRSKGTDKKDFKWLLSLTDNGTLQDKLSAALLTVEDSPLHNLQSIDFIITRLRDKSNRREIILILEPFKDLLINVILPDRKLKYLRNRRVTKTFLEKVQSNDEKCKRSLLVWYFEDRLKGYYSSFIDIVEKRILVDPVQAVKKRGIQVAFDLLERKPENENRILPLLVNKFGDPEHTISAKILYLFRKLLEVHPNMKTIVFKEIESFIFRPNIQSKAQFYAVCCLNQFALCASDRPLALALVNFYFCFFKVLTAAGKPIDSRFMSILLSGLKRAYIFCKDEISVDDEQIQAIFRLVHSSNFNTSIQALMLIFHIAEARNDLSDRYYSALYQKLNADELFHTSKECLFLSLLYRSIHKDSCDNRVKAFIKRLLQICLNATVSFIAGSLVLISKVSETKKSVLSLVQKSNVGIENFDSDDDGEKETAGCSWVFRNMSKAPHNNNSYDPLKRNPLFAGAENCCIHELLLLSKHHHPSISLFAVQLLSGKSIDYPGDPFEDFKLLKFFDRFAYKNPKKMVKRENATKGAYSNKRSYSCFGARGMPVICKEYAALRPSAVPPDEIYLHRFASDAHAKGLLKTSEESGDSELEDEVMDEELIKHMKNRMGMRVTDFNVDFASGYTRQLSTQKATKKTSSEEESDFDEAKESDELNEDESEFQTMDSEGHASKLNGFEETAESVSDGIEMSEFAPIESESFKISNQKEFKQIQWEMNKLKRKKPLKRRRKVKTKTKAQRRK